MIISDQEYDRMYRQWQEAVGQDTHSLESGNCYPEWVQNEFKDMEPMG